MLDDAGTPKHYQRHKIHSSSHFCLFQVALGSCSLRTDTTKQESHIMVDKLGARTSRHLLEKLGHTIHFLEHSKTYNITSSIRLGVFLHDPHRFCTISRKLGGSWKSCSFPQASDWNVSTITVSMVFKYHNNLMSNNLLVAWCLIVQCHIWFTSLDIFCYAWKRVLLYNSTAFSFCNIHNFSHTWSLL